MYRIIANDDFVQVLGDIPVRHLSVLSKSFISMQKCEENTLNNESNSFIVDLLEQLKNNELE